MELGVWGNIPWKYELNPFIDLGGDVKTSFDNETKTHGRTDGRTNKNKSSYRDHPLRGDLKTFSNNGPSYLLTYLLT